MHDNWIPTVTRQNVIQMVLVDDLNRIASKIPIKCGTVITEEATKNEFVLPFINSLGYNVFDTSEVVPEFTADVPGIRKDEKVDYAICKDGTPVILFECKKCGSDLKIEHASQLTRYFNSTEARIAILTNGIEYMFFSDFDKENRMDSTPFLEFRMQNLNDSDIKIIKMFVKSSFDLESILGTAKSLKYAYKIKEILDLQLNDPSDDSVRFFASQIYDGNLTQSRVNQFKPMIKDIFREFINDKIMKRISIVEDEVIDEKVERRPQPNDEELEAYDIICDILKNVVDINRVNYRDTASYCGIILDDNNRKPIARLYFNSGEKYIGTFDEYKNEEKTKIETLNDIYTKLEKITSVVGIYDSKKVQDNDEKSKIFFTFDGADYEVRFWKDMFHQICNIIAASHKDKFDEVLKLSGRKNPLFSRNSADLRSPELIEGTDIFVEVGFGAKYLTNLSNKVIFYFGYGEGSLVIKVKMD